MTLFDKHMPTRSRQKIEADLDEVLGEDSRPASCSRPYTFRGNCLLPVRVEFDVEATSREEAEALARSMFAADPSRFVDRYKPDPNGACDLEGWIENASVEASPELKP